jgi:phage portal protein BeeE/intein/homing endonuclease
MSLFRRQARIETRAIESLPWDVGGASPTTVSVERALSLVPVYAAIGLLARTVSCTPLHAYRRAALESRERITMPTLFSGLSDEAHLKRWIHQMVVSLASRGNLFGLVISRDGFGFPTAVQWLDPTEVSVEDRQLTGPGSVQMPIWRWNGYQVHVGPSDASTSPIIHVPWFPVPGRVLGLSPLGVVSAMVATGINAQDYAAEWFGNGGIPPGTMKNLARTLLPEEADAVKGRLVSTIRSRKPLVYGNDWDYNPIAIPPHEAAFVACVVPSTMFSMADGTRRSADRLTLGDEVISWDGQRLIAARVSDVIEQPVAPTVRVRTQCGRELVCTADHPFLASRRPRSPGKRYSGSLDSNSRWEDAGELRPGDYVRVALDWEGPSGDVDTLTGWALGALVGDGGLKGAGLTFHTVTPAIADRLGEWLARYGAELRSVATELRPADFRILANHFGPTPSPLKVELARFDVLGLGAADKRVPDEIMRGGRKAWAGFLSGYLDTDGSITSISRPAPIITWSSVSRGLLEDAQHLLALLGVNSSLRLHTKATEVRIRGRSCQRRDVWGLNVCGARNLHILASVLDLAHPVKAERLAAWAASGIRPGPGANGDTRWARVESVEAMDEQVTIGVTVEGTHTHVTAGIVTHNTAKLTATQVAAIYDVPPDRIGGEIGGPLTYSSPEQAAIHLVTFSLRNWYELFEELFSAMLPKSQYVKFVVDSLLRADIKTRNEVYKIQRSIGLTNINEQRVLEDLPPIPGELGDDYTPLAIASDDLPDPKAPADNAAIPKAPAKSSNDRPADPGPNRKDIE